MRNQQRTLKKAIISVESLDDRLLLSAAGVAHVAHPAAVHAVVKTHPAQAPKAAPKAAKATHAAKVASSAKAAAPQVTSVVRPSVAAPATVTAPTPTSPTSSTNVGDIQNGPLAKAGQQLTTIYQEYLQFGGSGTFTSSLSGIIEISGTNVGVDVHSGGGDFGAFVSELTSLGMKVQVSSAQYATVEGLLPIGQLLTVANLPQTLSINPVYRPRLHL
jgi:hypothetical protein